MRAVLAPLAVGLASCQVTIDYGGTQYACGDEEVCPSGSTCVAGECRPETPGPDGGGGGDGGSGSADARQGIPRCGDGVLRAGVEECDDGNLLDGDGCTTGCLTCSGGTYAGHCYTVTSIDGDWFTLRDECAAADGHLAAVTSSAEQEAILGFLGGQIAWIGLEDFYEGWYEWEDGEGFAFTGWMALQPDNGGGLFQEDCAEMRAEGWNDRACETVQPGLCEREPWVVRPDDGHAYKVLWTTMSYDDARQVCEGFGGHLATVRSQEEQDFLTDAIGVEVGIGLSRAGGTMWQWVSGEAVGYTNWRPGEPDNVPAGSDCTVMRDDGDWADRKCDDLRALCEVD